MAKAQHPRADRSALANLILKLAGEVRQQLGLQLAISHTLLDLRAVKEFQETGWSTRLASFRRQTEGRYERSGSRTAGGPDASLPSTAVGTVL